MVDGLMENHSDETKSGVAGYGAAIDREETLAASKQQLLQRPT